MGQKGRGLEAKMTETLQCPDCGTSLADEAPDGLCPKCLLRIALGSNDEETGPAAVEVTLDASATPVSHAAAEHVVRNFGD